MQKLLAKARQSTCCDRVANRDISSYLEVKDFEEQEDSKFQLQCLKSCLCSKDSGTKLGLKAMISGQCEQNMQPAYCSLSCFFVGLDLSQTTSVIPNIDQQKMYGFVHVLFPC